MDNTTLILSLTSTLLGGGALGIVVKSYFTSKSKDKVTDVDAQERLINQWEKMLAPLRGRVEHLEKRLEESRIRELDYKSEISTLKNQLMIFESSQINIPLPMWMKDTDGRIVYVNHCFEDEILIPIGLSVNSILGKKDEEIFAMEEAEVYMKNDNIVLRTKESINVIEPIKDGSGHPYWARNLKYPRKLGSRVIGISGITLETSSYKEDLYGTKSVQI
jgi:PAS domain-containing protein